MSSRTVRRTTAVISTTAVPRPRARDATSSAHICRAKATPSPPSPAVGDAATGVEPGITSNQGVQAPGCSLMRGCRRSGPGSGGSAHLGRPRRARRSAPRPRRNPSRDPTRSARAGSATEHRIAVSTSSAVASPRYLRSTASLTSIASACGRAGRSRPVRRRDARRNRGRAPGPSTEPVCGIRVDAGPTCDRAGPRRRDGAGSPSARSASSWPICSQTDVPTARLTSWPMKSVARSGPMGNPPRSRAASIDRRRVGDARLDETLRLAVEGPRHPVDDEAGVQAHRTGVLPTRPSGP